MAQSDGSIIIDTEIDSSGFQAGSNKIQRAIKSLNTKIESLAPTTKRAMAGSVSALATFDAKSEVLHKTISKIQDDMRAWGSAKLETDDYAWFRSELEKSEKALERLQDKQSKMEATGVSENSRAWKSLQYDILVARENVKSYREEMRELEANGQAFQNVSGTGTYQQLEEELRNVSRRLDELVESVSAANKEFSRSKSFVGTVKSALAKAGNIIGNIEKKTVKLGSAAKKLSGFALGAASSVAKLAHSTRKADSGFSRGLKSIIKYSLGIRTTYALVRELCSALEEGFQNLSQFDSDVNASLSSIISALLRLKNSFATAFAPLLNVAAPAITQFINLISDAVGKLGMFAATLTGKTAFTRAVSVQKDYAASLKSSANETKKVAKATKDAERQLASFDELNILSDTSSNSDSDSGTGGSGADISPQEMFETVEIPNIFEQYADKIKEMWDKADFTELGALLGSKLKSGLDNIPWGPIQDTTAKIAKSIATLLNGFLETEDLGKSIGGTLGQGINTALIALDTFARNFHWKSLGNFIGDSINGLFDSVRWTMLGATISDNANGIFTSLEAAVKTFNAEKAGKSFATSINRIFDPEKGIDFKKITRSISKLVESVLDTISKTIEDTNWQDIARAIENAVLGIDFSGLATSLARAIGAGLGGLSRLIGTFIADAFTAAKEFFQESIEECGGNIVEGILVGIGRIIASIGSWIYENIFTPFIDGFKSAFQIHSPSKVMAELGEFIILGLLNGISGMRKVIGDFFAEKLSAIKETFCEKWDSIYQNVTSAASSIYNTVKDHFGSMKDSTAEHLKNICDSVSSNFSEAEKNVKEAVRNIRDSANEKFTDMLDFVSNKTSSIKNVVGEGLKQAKDSAIEHLKTLHSTARAKFVELASASSEKMRNIRTSITNGFASAGSAASASVNSIAGTMRSKFTSAARDVRDKAASIGTSIKSSFNSAKDVVDKAIQSICRNASNRLTNLANDAPTWGKHICQNIADGIYSSITRVTDAAKSIAGTIRDYVGFSEPEKGPLSKFHTFMPDMLQLMARGIRENKSLATEAVVDVAQKIANAAKNAKAVMPITAEISQTGVKMDRTLLDFSDKISGSFSDLMDRLSSIADSCTFAIPDIALGKILPYASSSPSQAFYENQPKAEELNDELISVLIQCTNTVTAAVVSAIEKNGNKHSDLSKRDIAQAAIDEINRRTKMVGKSPLTAGI